MSFNLKSSESNFTFKQRAGRLNWRQIQGLDLNRIIETGDVLSLQSMLENIAYASLDREDLERFSDSSLMKLFKLSQLSIEYLMHSQDKLHSQALSLDSQRKEVASKAAALEESVRLKENEVEEYKREVSNKRKTLSTYDFLLKQPQAAVALSASSAVNSHKCSKCGKHFLNQAFLDKHISRRHPQPDETVRSTETTAMLEMIKVLVSQSMQSMQETHTREVESLKYTFEKQLSEVQKSHEQMESQRSNFFDSQKASPAKEDVFRDFFIQQQKSQQEKSPLLKAFEDQKAMIEKLTQDIAETNSQLVRKSEEAARAVALQQLQEERNKIEIEKVLNFELQKQRDKYNSENSLLIEQLQALALKPKTPQSISTPPPTPDIRVETPVRPRAPPPRMSSNAGELELDIPSPRPSTHFISNAGDLELDTSDLPKVEQPAQIAELEKIEPKELSESFAEGEEEFVSGNKKRVALEAQNMDSFEGEEITADIKGTALDEAAKQIGIEEFELMYIAEEYLASPMPEGWEQVDLNGQVYYRNAKSMITYTNPSLEVYRKKYLDAKAELAKKYEVLTVRLKMLMKSNNKIMSQEYPGGISTYFVHRPEGLVSARGLVKREFVSSSAQLTLKAKSSTVANSLLEEFAMIRSRITEELKERQANQDAPPKTPVREAPLPMTPILTANSIRIPKVESPVAQRTPAPESLLRSSVNSAGSFGESFERAPESSKPSIGQKLDISRHVSNESQERLFKEQSQQTFVVEAELNDIKPVESLAMNIRRKAISQLFKTKQRTEESTDEVIINPKSEVLSLLNLKGWVR